MTRPIITFTSDFGTQDWFVGVVHGVVHELAPEARVVNLTHAIPPGDVERAAFVLEAAAADFPAGTIHLAVVDPGVGTARRALAVRAREQFFVGPDNGVLEHGLSDPAAEARRLSDGRFFRHPVSRTFHGRDVFAPVAAHLARAVPFVELGPVVSDPRRLPPPPLVHGAGEIEGRIRYIDRFGNALTDLRDEALERAFPGASEESLVVRVGSQTIRGIARSYGDRPVGTVVAVMGSSGRLEIAMVGGDVSLRFGIGVGDHVRVRLRA
jgi:S-adenosylmethionine hydrolase